MKKTTKKLLAVAMAVPMAISACSFGALADDLTSITTNNATGDQTGYVSYTVSEGWTVNLPAISSVSSSPTDMSFDTCSGESAIATNSWAEVGAVEIVAKSKFQAGKTVNVTARLANSQLTNGETSATTLTCYLAGDTLGKSDSNICTVATGTASDIASASDNITGDLYLQVDSEEKDNLPADEYVGTITFSVSQDSETA